MNIWIAGARPKTLPVAISPVLIASTIVWYGGGLDLVIAIACALIALLFQIGVNYANDYSDGIRGTDDARHTTGGPVRLVGQGLAAPAKVRLAAWLCFGLACVIGLAVVVTTDHVFLLYLGAACVPAAWFYTGGGKPYGYIGLGELSVFIFFGLVAVLGTALAQTGQLTLPLWLAASGQGAIASAVLVANNLRDIPTDRDAGKQTLAVRIGDRATRVLYIALDLGGAVATAAALYLITNNWIQTLGFVFVCAFIAWGSITKVRKGATGRDLVSVLAFTGKYMLFTSALASACLIAVKVAIHAR